MNSANKLTCVLFDLDGTLVDTANDLVNALNVALVEHQLPPVSAEVVKPYISFGASSMLQHSIQDPLSAEQQTQVLDTLLTYYQDNIANSSRLYAGMETTLAKIEDSGLKWGVITNKRRRFTEPLLQALNLTSRLACMISGDTTAYSKPHAAPMLAACTSAGVLANECVFIGDAYHDIAAGRAVHMRTLVATYGYLHAEDQPETWGADALMPTPSHISDWIDTVLCH